MDDIMLNIVTPAPRKSPHPDQALSKTDAKKMKYSAKLKMKKKGHSSKTEGVVSSSGMFDQAATSDVSNR